MNSISKRLDDVEERISELEEWSVKLPKPKDREKKTLKKNRLQGFRLPRWSLDFNKAPRKFSEERKIFF